MDLLQLREFSIRNSKCIAHQSITLTTKNMNSKKKRQQQQQQLTNCEYEMMINSLGAIYFHVHFSENLSSGNPHSQMSSTNARYKMISSNILALLQK